LQRELNRDTAIELRYVGTHGTRLWRQYNYNEVNIFENGFLKEFNAARNNLLIFAHQANSPCKITERGGLISIREGTCNYGNTGLAGQVDIPLIQNAINSTTDLTTATQLFQGQAGALANGIAFTAARMGRLFDKNLVKFVTLPNGVRVSNHFIANPQTQG